MRVGFYQFEPAFGRVQANLERIDRALEGVDADLVVLPELATSGYLFTAQAEVNRLAEPVPGPSTEALEGIARRWGVHLVMGLPERADGGVYNSAVVVGPQGLVGTYRKVHLFYEERRYFLPGNEGFLSVEVAGARVGVLICFDHLFPEAARTLALAGAQLIAHPSNLVLPGVAQLSTRVRALENRVFWALANRIGTEERGGRRLSYTGCSQLVSPQGKLLAEAPAAEPALGVVELDPAEALDKHVTPLNDLWSDRRPGAYRL